MVIKPISSADLTVPMGYQIVNDGLLYDGEVRDQLKNYPVGTVIYFRKEPLGKWCRFLETRCGGSSQQMFENGVAILVVGLLCCSTLFQVGYFGTGLVFSTLLMIQISPAACAVFIPQLAPYLHGVISFAFGLLSFILTLIAAPWNSMTFWLMPILAISTHFLLLQRRFPHFRAVSVSLMMLVTLLLALFLFLSIDSALQPVLPPPREREFGNFTFPAQGHGSYDLECGLSFPTSHPSIFMRLADFGFLNSASYLPDRALHHELALFADDWQVAHAHRRELLCASGNCDIQDWATWFAFVGKDGTGLENTTIVVIRGTKTKLEMIFDLDLWSLQILGIQHLAGRFLLGIGTPYNAFWNSPTLGSCWFRSKRNRYRSALTYLKDLMENESHRKIYVSGHSLGGGIAHLLASELELPAVTLSAPGVVETAGLLGLQPLRLQGTVNVIPNGDPIPANGGTQGGITVPIPCIAGQGPDCHRVFNTICMLLKQCGDPKQRRIPCDFCPMEAEYHSDCDHRRIQD
eukprot:symbB.v1.2.033303.t1/scaffold4114.1/size44431/2